METPASGSKKWSRFAPLFILAPAFPPLINSFDNPHLKGLRGPDVMQLIVIGMCVGAALTMFFVGFLGSHRSS